MFDILVEPIMFVSWKSLPLLVNVFPRYHFSLAGGTPIFSSACLCSIDNDGRHKFINVFRCIVGL